MTQGDESDSAPPRRRLGRMPIMEQLAIALLAGDVMQHLPDDYRERLDAGEAQELADQVFGAWLRSHAPEPGS